MKSSALDAAVRSAGIESKAVLDVLECVNTEAFGRAVDAMSHCDKIITSGCGGSGIAAKKFAHSLCCIEKNGYFLSPSEALHGGLGCVKKEDVVLLLSRGGKTAELMPIVSVCNEKKATLIAVTENNDSPLALRSQILIPMHVEQESDPCGIMTTTSFVMAVALFDAMLSAIMVETGYRIEQFALIHPGGAVGELLNTADSAVAKKTIPT